MLMRISSLIQLPLLLCLAASAVAGQSSQPAARLLTTGESIYLAGCAGCHGPGGEGSPQTTIGFDKPETFPDFTDCSSTTPELDVDWKATIHDGGRGRGFSRIMPSFAEELTSAQIDAVITHLRGFCRDSSWPRGELNLPRPLATEKAFPEDETVITTTVGAHHAPNVTNELVYEHRVGVGLKHVLFASHRSIFSAQGELVMPTGNEAKGLGSGVTIVEAFASYGQILPAAMFLQAQAGTEQPTSTDVKPRAVFGRVAVGKSFRQELGLGRLWSPMLELVADRDLEDG